MEPTETLQNTPTDLDPADWPALRALGHRMLDDMLDHLSGVRAMPVWQPMPDALREELQEKLPRTPQGAEASYEAFQRLVLPYATGNLHPRFMGWVHGGGTPIGGLAELLAGMLNANLGGRDHAPIEVERQVIRWAAEMLGLPPTSSGLMVTGTSIANLIGLLVARTDALGRPSRRRGLGDAKLTAYTSAAAHECIVRAMEMAGIGSDHLRLIPVDADYRIDLAALEHAIDQDIGQGLQPFLVVGTAGTVDTGSVDDLDRLAGLCAARRIWFHVDGAFGALAMLAPELAPALKGIERADSVAFDFHKWGQAPYDAGCIVVRDPAKQMAAFAQNAAYLRREMRGLAGGHPWPCDLGPDLSRGFRALKVWMTLKTHGADAIGAAVSRTCAIARHLAARVEAEPTLELLAPVALNIVCFRPVGLSDRAVADLVADLHEDGTAAPSTTTIGGRLAIRAAIVNHRTQESDVDALADLVLAGTAVRREV